MASSMSAAFIHPIASGLPLLPTLKISSPLVWASWGVKLRCLPMSTPLLPQPGNGLRVVQVVVEGLGTAAALLCEFFASNHSDGWEFNGTSMGTVSRERRKHSATKRTKEEQVCCPNSVVPGVVKCILEAYASQRAFCSGSSRISSARSATSSASSPMIADNGHSYLPIKQK